MPTDDARWRSLDPSQRRQRTLDAVKSLLLRESQAQPLLLVFEDLQGVDSETQALRDSLVESLPLARIALLVNYRPEYSHGWAGKSYYSRLMLNTLQADGAGELLEALATQRLGQAYASLGEYRRAVEAFGRQLARGEAEPSRERPGAAGLGAAANRAWMAWCLASLGDFAESGAHAEEAVRLAEAAQHDLSLAMTYSGAGRPHLIQGNFPTAIAWLTRSAEICRHANFAPLFFLVTCDLGHAPDAHPRLERDHARRGVSSRGPAGGRRA